MTYSEPQVLLHVAVEIDADQRNLAKKNHPGVLIVNGVNEITYKNVLGWLKIAPGTEGVLATAGSPCQDPSALNVGGKGLEGDRRILFFRAMMIFQWLEKLCTGMGLGKIL